jgi:predicted permease
MYACVTGVLVYLRGFLLELLLKSSIDPLGMSIVPRFFF